MFSELLAQIVIFSDSVPQLMRPVVRSANNTSLKEPTFE